MTRMNLKRAATQLCDAPASVKAIPLSDPFVSGYTFANGFIQSFVIRSNFRVSASQRGWDSDPSVAYAKFNSFLFAAKICDLQQTANRRFRVIYYVVSYFIK